MDIKIENGDFKLSADGRPKVIFGKEALLQRITNRLKLKKGSVFLNSTLGSELYLLCDCPENELISRASELVFDALKDMQSVHIKEVSAKRADSKIDIYVSFTVGDKNLVYEVNI